MNKEEAIVFLDNAGATYTCSHELMMQGLDAVDEKYSNLTTEKWVRMLPESLVKCIYDLLMKFGEQALKVKMKHKHLREIPEYPGAEEEIFVDFFQSIDSYEKLCNLKNASAEAQRKFIKATYEALDLIDDKNFFEDQSSDIAEEIMGNKVPSTSSDNSGKQGMVNVAVVTNINLDVIRSIRKDLTESFIEEEKKFHGALYMRIQMDKPKSEILWRTEFIDFIRKGSQKNVEDFKKQYGTDGLGKLKKLISDDVVRIDDSEILLVN